MDTTPFSNVLPWVIGFLGLRDVCAIKAASRGCKAAAHDHFAEQLAVVRCPIMSVGPCARIFETYGRSLPSLKLSSVTFMDELSLGNVLRACPNLFKLVIQDCVWTNVDMNDVVEALGTLTLTELRLVVDESFGPHPWLSHIVSNLHRLPRLQKLCIVGRITNEAVHNLVEYIRDATASRRLQKLKISCSIIMSSEGRHLVSALQAHPGIQRFTVQRHNASSGGESLTADVCTAIAQMLIHNTNITALHLRRCGLTLDTLYALAPSKPCPHVRRVKLDGNRLGTHGSSRYFHVVMYALLSHLPSLQTLHLGNNSIEAGQAVELARTFEEAKVSHLENLTIGSNEIGDSGLAALLTRLPPTMRQLYLHGTNLSDAGMKALAEALVTWPHLWGLGLNGNPISDRGAEELSTVLPGLATLRDVGITLSDMTDAGCLKLAEALHRCDNLRFVYLYTAGFKAAQRVTPWAKEHLRARLPVHATAAFEHRLSRYIKHP